MSAAGSEVSWHGIPLPANGAQFGGPSWCSLQVPLSFVDIVATDAVGRTSRTISLPPYAAGFTLRSQFAVVDGNLRVPLPVVLSEGLRMPIYR
jgi:hypothetical protein